jgi:hypothetical protein
MDKGVFVVTTGKVTKRRENCERGLGREALRLGCFSRHTGSFSLIFWVVYIYYMNTWKSTFKSTSARMRLRELRLPAIIRPKGVGLEAAQQVPKTAPRISAWIIMRASLHQGGIAISGRAHFFFSPRPWTVLNPRSRLSHLHTTTVQVESWIFCSFAAFLRVRQETELEGDKIEELDSERGRILDA